MFRKILIANRGEIACRVIRACKDLGIKTVAVYSDIDKAALHVRMADEAYNIGPPPSSESYLRIDKIIEVAKKSGAQAIHPGYGFLSENADFVREAQRNGIVFIGPPPEAMEAMGGKISARKIAIDAGVPVVPGTVEPIKDFGQALKIARDYGFPIMLKASAGGGGKGMRLVQKEEDLRSAFDTAKGEALSAFGDDSVYIEKAIVRPRHIEIQVFSDMHGNHVHLGERECSIQRRHQKVIEECPSPINDAELRQKMGEAAVKIARAVNYVGAGTVEFLVSDESREFYFLEMNTRLQVEHPVTELVTGIDLVKEQILVAFGKTLSFAQEEIQWRGHAIECRIYAEDFENNFIPSPGRIDRLRIPQGNGIRDDGGVYPGSEVSIYYDPMISKFCTYGRNREEAISRLRRALSEYEIAGIKTTLQFFREIIEDEEFQKGMLDTGFIERWSKRRKVIEAEQIERDLAAIAAALRFTSERKRSIDAVSANNNLHRSQWQIAGRLAMFANRL
jgi:acetyl-CoA carboxylase biotin carboxylase subunit